ncbi:hypothetical protein N7532_010442 [Penicillium argentinense]|uniref:Uncharacterized protein n=1 Tax=Penicillium argentinense TaxID=1131581 RepID=A0A9W9EPP0_9EURO|nr:uncharacterized protein N7532_010442 [Penicillium argentinense]KAJ5085671.1 hypothetical protein N7532_010442 [Penicillium argentinense]
MGLALPILFASTISYLIPAPTAFAEVGWKYYLLFIILSVGIALEEIGETFGGEVVIHLTGLSDEQKEDLDKAIETGRRT